MKKLILLFCIIAIKSYSQDLKLSIDYLEPRVGQTFVLTFDPTFLNEFLSGQLPRGVTEYKSISYDNVFRYSLKAEAIGEKQIGPYTFDFNNTAYKTDSILINIHDELPKTEGLWIRNYKKGKYTYVIIEEQLPQENNKDFDSYQFTNLIQTFSDDITISNISSSKSTIRLDNKSDSLTLIYSRSIYKAENKSSKDIKLNKRFFNYLPKGFKLPQIVLPPNVENKRIVDSDYSFSIFDQNCLLSDSKEVDLEVKFIRSIKNIDKVNSNYGFIKHQSLISAEAKALVRRVMGRLTSSDVNQEMINNLLKDEVKKEKQLWKKYYLDNVIIEIQKLKIKNGM